MGISSETDKINYTGNGSVSTYTFPFKIFRETDLIVTKKTISTGAETPLTLTTDYTVSGVGLQSGGSITLVAGNLPSTHKIYIRRKLALTQETDIRNLGAFYPSIHEDKFDELTMQIQQVNFQANQSVRLPETVVSGFDPKLPVDIASANKTIIVNPSGNGLVMGPTADQIASAQSYATAALASKNAAELAETNAELAETNAETAETNAEAAQAAAEAAQAAAEAAQAAAELAETNAETAETNAETAQAAAEAAQAAAEAAKVAAELAETNAETAETNAQGYAAAALASKNAAELAETNAELAETNAEAAEAAAVVAKNAAEAAAASLVLPTSLDELTNFALDWSISGGAITWSVKTKAGTDPSASDQVFIGFRSSTGISGAYNRRNIAAPLSFTLSSGSTLGITTAGDRRIWLYLVDLGGTVKLAVSATPITFPANVQTGTTTAEGGAGGADSLYLLYSDTSYSGCPVRLIGYCYVAGDAAGVYTTKRGIVLGDQVSSWDYNPMTHYYRSSVLGIPHSSYFALKFNYFVHDDFSRYNSTTGVFKPEKNGFFVFEGCLVWSAHLTTIQVSLYLREYGDLDAAYGQVLAGKQTAADMVVGNPFKIVRYCYAGFEYTLETYMVAGDSTTKNIIMPSQLRVYSLGTPV